MYKVTLQDKAIAALEAYLAQRLELKPMPTAAEAYNGKTESVRAAIRMLKNQP